jgi:hypothetical protein
MSIKDDVLNEVTTYLENLIEKYSEEELPVLLEKLKDLISKL